MTDAAGKRVAQVTGVVVVAQMFAPIAFDNIWSVVLPPLLGSIPVALLTIRSPIMVERTAPRLRQYYAFACAVGLAVIGWFLVSGHPDFGLELVRAAMASLAILSLASTLSVQIATPGNRQSKPAA